MKSAISVSTAEDIQVPVFKEHIVIPLIAIAVVLVVMNTMMFNLSLPQITKELALSTKVSSWTITGYSIVFAISSLTYSRLSDFLPIRLLIIIGVTSLGSASILGFFSNSFIMLLSARLIQAFGAGAIVGLGIVLISRYVPMKRRGKSMSIVMSASSLGLGLGPVLGGAITQYFGWNYLFALTSVTLLLIPFFYYLLPIEKAKKVSFDFIGAILVGIGTTGLLLVLTIRSVYVFGLSLIVLVLFGIRIHHTKNPFVKPELFRNKAYMMLSFLGIISYINNFGTLFLLPQILTHVYDLTPGQTGLIIFPGAIFSMFAAPLIGKTIDAFGNGLLIRVAPWILLSAGILFGLYAVTSFYAVMIIYAVMSVSFSAITTSVSNEISRILPEDLLGSGMGLFQLTQFFSGAFSVAIIGSALIWQKQLLLTTAYSNIFFAMACLTLLVTLFSFTYKIGIRKEKNVE